MAFGIRVGLLGVLLGVSTLCAACGDDANSAAASDSEAGSAAAEGGAAPEGGAGGSDATPQGGEDAGPPARTELLGRLQKLGAQTDLPSAPLDQEGNPLPDGYHPLRKPFATLRPRQEIYFAGPQFNNQREGLLNDGFDHNAPGSSFDANAPFQELLPKPVQPAWLDYAYRAAIAADVNGDGIQEFVAIYYDEAAKQLKGKVIWGPDQQHKRAHEDDAISLASIDTGPSYANDWFQYSVTAANVDDDPADELFVGCGDLFVFDDYAHGMQELNRKPLGSERVTVCHGDFDANVADPTDEVMVMWKGAKDNAAHYQVYDGADSTITKDRILRPTFNDPARSEHAFHSGFCVAASVDRDPAQEVAIIADDDQDWRVFLMDDANTAFRTFDSFRNSLLYTPNLALAAADIDGDGIDELVAGKQIFDGLENLPPSSSTETLQNGDQLEKPTDVTNTPHGLENAYQVRRGRVAPDFGYPANENAEQFVALDSHSGQLVYSARNPTKNNELAWISLGSIERHVKGDVLAVGNVDFDSPVVRYTGKHEVLYSNPELLVGLAAPPFYAATNQDDSSSTSFGRGDATSVEKETSLGFSVGFSFGYESSDPFGIASSSFKVAVSQAFDAVASEATSVSESVTYTGGPEDSVVFTVVPFDVYYYDVVSPVDPSGTQTPLSVNLPRKPQTLIATSEYFDRFVDEARKSAPLFQTHRVGEPFSYSSVAERDDLCRTGCFESSEAYAIGQGKGSTTVEISESEDKGRGASYSYDVSVESEASVGGVSFGTSVGFSYGYAVNTTISKNMVFVGQIGSLADLTSENSYSVGIFAHQQLHATSNKPILMVDYWVER